MGTFVLQRSGRPDPSSYGPRRAGAGGRYRAFVPDPLVPGQVLLDARVAADVADAERALVELDQAVATQRAPHRL